MLRGLFLTMLCTQHFSSVTAQVQTTVIFLRNETDTPCTLLDEAQRVRLIKGYELGTIREKGVKLYTVAYVDRGRECTLTTSITPKQRVLIFSQDEFGRFTWHAE